MSGQVWCLRCGSTASLEAESLDPRRPLVRCPTRIVAGRLVSGCGRVVGTRVEAEAEAVARRFRGRTATRQHRRHLDAGEHDPDCARCREALDRLRPTRGIR